MIIRAILVGVRARSRHVSGALRICQIAPSVTADRFAACLLFLLHCHHRQVLCSSQFAMTFGFGWGSKRRRSQETDPLLGSSSPPAYTPIAPEYGSPSNGPVHASAQHIPSPQVVVQPVIFHHHHHHPGYYHGRHRHHGRRRGSACKRFCCSLLLLSFFVAAAIPIILYFDEIVRWVKRQTGLQVRRPDLSLQANYVCYSHSTY